ncbi:MAG TPA: CHAD domain-containing protein, partial [Solirubrobacteraceae bacterium]|nr:CHAD domain-containing protein [Solirubrobacteraceae bacterium]
LEAGVPPRRTRIQAASRYLLSDIPAGPVRRRLAGVLEERALLPLARVNVSQQALAVCNDDAKTVVRLTVEQLAVVADRGRRIPLTPRLRLTPVRGYDAAFEQAERAIRQALAPDPADRPVVDDAVAAVGGHPGGVSSKPRVALEEGLPAGRAAGLVLLRLADIAEANLPGTLEDLDTEFLHDLRVSIRRARSVLRELKDVFEPGALARVRAELRWAQAVTGPVRDLDVQLLEWDELAALVPADRADGLAPLRGLLDDRRRRELGALRRGLRSKRFSAGLAAWRALAEASQQPGDAGQLAAVPVEAVTGARIRHVYRRMVRDGRAIGADSPDEALHDLRKRGKELRYLLEFFGGLYPAAVVKPMVAALKDLQDVLGRFQDRTVQAETLRDHGEELATLPGGPGALIALGSLIDALEADQRAARAAFEDRFAAFASKRERAQVKATFPKAATP